MVNFLRKTWLTLSLILLCTGVHAAIYNGTSGGTNWTVDTGTGVLTISKSEGGSGITEDYLAKWCDYNNCESCREPYIYIGCDESRAPWYSHRRYIKTIIVEEGVVELETAAFRDLTNVTSVSLPTSLTTIGHEAFRNCTSLDSVYVPKNVCNLKDRWVTECSDLSVIEIDKANQCYFVDKYGAVYTKDTTTLVVLPQDMIIDELIIIDGVTSFATDALYGHKHLTQLRLPASMTVVEYGALDNMRSLKTIYFESEKAPIFRNEIGGGTNTSNLAVYIPCVVPEDPNRPGEFGTQMGVSVKNIELYLNTYVVEAVPDNQRKGSTSVINETSCEDNTVTIIAKPNAGYNFLRWESNKSSEIITQAEYKYKCTRDEVFTAYFVHLYLYSA
jgi:hypothetical protein